MLASGPRWKLRDDFLDVVLKAYLLSTKTSEQKLRVVVFVDELVPRLESVHEFCQLFLQLLLRVDVAGVAHEAEVGTGEDELSDSGCDRAVPRLLAAKRAGLDHNIQNAAHDAGLVFGAVVLL